MDHRLIGRVRLVAHSPIMARGCRGCNVRLPPTFCRLIHSFGATPPKSGLASSGPESSPMGSDPIADDRPFRDGGRMRAYGIFPTFDFRSADESRTQNCISLVSEIVLERLRAGGDEFHYVVDWRDPESSPWQGWTEDLAEPHVIPLSDPDKLARLVRMSVDPFSVGSAAVIRSIATCRAATFGFDGQDFLCLRHEDEPPASPDSTLVTIEELPDLLTGTDYFDGWLRAASTPPNDS